MMLYFGQQLKRSSGGIGRHASIFVMAVTLTMILSPASGAGLSSRTRGLFDGNLLMKDNDTNNAEDKCPSKEPQTGDRCNPDLIGQEDCFWGTETCCGVTHNSYGCTCTTDGWACYATDACMAPTCCPEERATPGEFCFVPEDKECRWGEVSCCGQTFDTFACQCVGNEWQCLVIDACLNPTC